MRRSVTSARTAGVASLLPLILTVLAAVVAAVVALPAPASATPPRSAAGVTTADPGAPARIVPVIADAAWSIYMNPRVLATAKATYIGTTSTRGDIDITRVAHGGHKTDHTRLQRIDADMGGPRTPRTGATALGGTKTNGIMDDHASPSILQLPDGRILVSWTGHTTIPVRYRISTRPDSITSFGPVQTLAGSGIDTRRAVYTQIHHLAGETYPYWVITRLRESDNRGNWYVARSRDLVRWTKAFQLTTNPYPKEVTKGWPYVKTSSDGQRTLDLAVTDGDPTNLRTNSLFHIRYRAGAFYRTDGTRIRTLGQVIGTGGKTPRPLDPRSGTLVHDGTAGQGWARVYDVRTGAGGEVAMAATANRAGTQPTEFKWFTASSGGWSASTVTSGPQWPTGYELTPGMSNRLYLIPNSAGTDGAQQIQEWGVPDDAWTARTVATSPPGESMRNPVAPVAATPTGLPSGRISVLWMQGIYHTYNDFNTRLMMETTGPAPVTLTRSVNTTARKGYANVTVRVHQGVDGPGARGVTVRVVRTTPAGNSRSVVTRTSGTGLARASFWAPKGTRIKVEVAARDGWGSAVAGTVTVR